MLVVCRAKSILGHEINDVPVLVSKNSYFFHTFFIPTSEERVTACRHSVRAKSEQKNQTSMKNS